MSDLIIEKGTKAMHFPGFEISIVYGASHFKVGEINEIWGVSMQGRLLGLTAVQVSHAWFGGGIVCMKPTITGIPTKVTVGWVRSDAPLKRRMLDLWPMVRQSFNN